MGKNGFDGPIDAVCSSLIIPHSPVEFSGDSDDLEEETGPARRPDLTISTAPDVSTGRIIAA